MTEDEIYKVASRFSESLSEAQISEINDKAIPTNTKKATKFGLGVFQDKVLFLNIILRISEFHKRSRTCNAYTKLLSTSEFIYKFRNTA